MTRTNLEIAGSARFFSSLLMAILSFLVYAFTGHEILGTIVLLFFFLGGVGVRVHSRYAAAVVLILYLVDTVATGPNAVRVGIAAVLFSNLRATWIASTWNPESTEAMFPPRLAETWSDKFSDTLPTWLWPNIRMPFYVFSIAFLLLEALGVIIILRRHA
jgi:hypothetical protein